jgi:hypothetical protein
MIIFLGLVEIFFTETFHHLSLFMLARATITALEDMFSDIEAFPKLMPGMNH